MKCVNLAVNAVVTGEADVLMKGLVSTDKYMRGILNKDAGLFPPKGTLSHVAVVEMPNYPSYWSSRRSGDSAARLQTENHPDRLPDAHRQPDRHQDAEDRLHRTFGAVVAERALLDRSRSARQDGRSRTAGQRHHRRPLSLDVALYKDVAEHKKSKVRP